MAQSQVGFFDLTGEARLVLLWENDIGLVRQPVPQTNFYHSKSLLGKFPKQVTSYSQAGRVEAFYRTEPFEWNACQLRWSPPVNDGNRAITGYIELRIRYKCTILFFKN